LFDMTGLFVLDDTVWTRVAPTGTPQPSSLYATHVAVRRAWIDQTMTAHPPELPRVLAAAAVDGPFTEVTTAVADPAAAVIRLTPSAGTAFYRLSAACAVRITSASLDGGDLVLHYQ
jgi:hypothetical protein